MKFDRNLFLLACALLVVACGRVSGSEGAGGRVVPAATAQQAPRQTAAPAPPSRAQTFRGIIGDNLRVRMRLQRDGDALSGSYFYESRKVDLSLKGSVNGQGDFTLREYTSAGAQTGVFKGKWETDGAGRAELSGQWSRPDGSRAAPFTLTEFPVEFGAGAELATRTIKEDNKKLRYTVAAEYPQVEGAGGGGFDGFNRTAAALARGEVDKFRKELGDWEQAPGTEVGSYLEVGYLVGIATDDLVSVRFDIGDYYSGAAHPNHYTKVINYDVRGGRVLGLADLFKPSALYLQAVSDYCVKDLKQQFRRGEFSEPEQLDADIEEGAAPHAKNYESWLVTRRGLSINFDPYQVAPYAAGPQHVLIPYAALREIINPDGPLAPFVK